MLDNNSLNKQIMTRRTFVIGAGKLGLLFLLAGRMFYMQFIKKNEYKTLSDKNSIKTIILTAKRGDILDRNNVVLAKNKSCFRLLLDKNGNPKFSLEVDLIVKILELDKEQIKEIEKRIKKGGRRIPTMIIDYLDWSQISIIEERRPELKSVFIDAGLNRDYPVGWPTAHIIGYMGKPSKEDGDLNFIDESFKVGKSGIENRYEETLRGELGYKRIEVNAYGKYVRELSKNTSTPGNNLQLNIDSELQKRALEYLNPKGSSAIVMDCTSGQMLISASTPTYEPNQFLRLSHKYWGRLINNPYKPLIDKTIKSLYPPGSIFKLITVLAALEAGIDPTHKVVCTGQPFLGGNRFRCARRRGHGAVNMNDAMKYSCNSYIFDVARRIGADKIIEVARKFGLGNITGIDLPGELSGFVPSKEWKQQRYNNKWQLGDTLNLAIGQGFLLTTPMQLARMIAAFASDGKLFTPQIVNAEPQYTQINVEQQHLDIIKKTLYDTINSHGGTGYFSKINYKSMKMAGKTGTAQVQGKKNADDDLNRTSINWESRNHAIFTGYAPFDNPKYAICVYYDHGGGGGSSASPIARKIMEDILKKYM